MKINYTPGSSSSSSQGQPPPVPPKPVEKVIPSPSAAPLKESQPLGVKATPPPEPGAHQTDQLSKTVFLLDRKNKTHPLFPLSQQVPLVQETKDIKEMVKGIGVSAEYHHLQDVNVPHNFYLDVHRSTEFIVGPARFTKQGGMSQDVRTRQVYLALINELGEEAAKNAMQFLHQGMFVAILEKILSHGFLYIETQQKHLQYAVQVREDNAVFTISSNFELKDPKEMENSLGFFQARRTVVIPLRELQVDASQTSQNKLFPSMTSQIQFYPIVARKP